MAYTYTYVDIAHTTKLEGVKLTHLSSGCKNKNPQFNFK